MAIDIWAALLTRPLTDRETEALLELMPAWRRERLERVRDRARWREPLCAYAILRRALWERWRWRDLPEMTVSSMGKPGFPGYPEVQFNLSHTGGAVVIALADQPVGVDIEHIRPVSERAMRRLADTEHVTDFFRSWVRREARAKRSGNGVGTMLESETPMQPGELFYYIDTFPGYVAGVCTRDPCGLGRIQKFSLDDMV